MLDSKLLRRLVSIPAVFLAAVLLTLPMPIAMPLALHASPTTELRGVARTLAFLWCFLWCEAIGSTVAFWLWIRHRDAERFLAANYRLQCAWSMALKRAAERLFLLEFDVGGEAALQGAGAIMMPRHTSIADTIIPMVFYAVPQHIRLRYVLKRELLLDPCLDIVGNRLPNCFVDRFADNAGPEVAKVAALADDLTETEGILIYPEGTRFSAERRLRALERIADVVSRAELDRMDPPATATSRRPIGTARSQSRPRPRVLRPHGLRRRVAFQELDQWCLGRCAHSHSILADPSSRNSHRRACAARLPVCPVGSDAGDCRETQSNG